MADVSEAESVDTDITQIDYREHPVDGEFSLSSIVQISFILSVFLHFFGICHEKVYYFFIILPSFATTLKVFTDEDTLFDTQTAVLRYWCFFSLFWIFDLFIPFNYAYSFGKLFLHGYFLQKVLRPQSLYTFKPHNFRSHQEMSRYGSSIINHPEGMTSKISMNKSTDKFTCSTDDVKNVNMNCFGNSLMTYENK